MTVRTDEMTCKELVELVTDYLEGRLPDGELARFEQHLGDCEGCAMHLDQMRMTIAALGELREETVPQPAADALLAEFRDWKQARPA